MFMTPEEKSLLERTNKLAEENNTILKSMRRSARFANALKLAYWVVIIFLSIGAYYAIQPYVNTMISYTPELQNILKTLPTPR